MTTKHNPKSNFVKQIPIEYNDKKYFVLTIMYKKKNDRVYEIPTIIDASDYPII